MSGISLGGPKQYGLIKKPVVNQNKGLVANKKPILFSNDDDDIDEVDDSNDTNAIKRANRFIISSKSTQKSAVVQDDIAIYDYDGAYDSFKSNDNSSSSSHPLLSSEGSSNLPKPKPKYIESIIATSKIREKEQERMKERKLVRERQKEDELYGDTEKFMTSAYKKKLEEEKKWEYEDKLTDIVEQKTDYRSRGMHGFYSNLMNKNVSTVINIYFNNNNFNFF
jgi:coiled-coil domain-containing protein 55